MSTCEVELKTAAELALERAESNPVETDPAESQRLAKRRGIKVQIEKAREDGRQAADINEKIAALVQKRDAEKAQCEANLDAGNAALIPECDRQIRLLAVEELRLKNAAAQELLLLLDLTRPGIASPELRAELFLVGQRTKRRQTRLHSVNEQLFKWNGEKQFAIQRRDRDAEHYYSAMIRRWTAEVDDAQVCLRQLQMAEAELIEQMKAE